MMNQFLEKYAGVYEIEVAGYRGEDAEVYVLNSDGSAEWFWMRSVMYTSGPPGSKKTGRWTAMENFISITIDGIAGPITSDYRHFRQGDHYLRKV